MVASLACWRSGIVTGASGTLQIPRLLLTSAQAITNIFKKHFTYFVPINGPTNLKYIFDPPALLSLQANSIQDLTNNP